MRVKLLLLLKKVLHTEEPAVTCSRFAVQNAPRKSAVTGGWRGCMDAKNQMVQKLICGAGLLLLATQSIGGTPAAPTTPVATKPINARTPIFSNDRRPKTVKEVADKLLDMDQVFATNPVVYFNEMNSLLNDISQMWQHTSPQDESLRLLRSSVFCQALRKPCPTNQTQALLCFDSKKNMVLRNVGGIDVANGKTQILALATYLGEIRSWKTIANLNAGPVTFSVVGPSNYFATPEGIKEISTLEAESSRNDETHRLRTSLTIQDAFFLGKLLKLSRSYCAAHPDDLSFRDEVSGAAHLTTDEIKKLAN